MVVLDNPKKKPSRFTQVNTILYKTNTQLYQIKVSKHLRSWEIPPMYYHARIDPLKAFLQNNTIKNYANRLYWKNREMYVKIE